MRSESPEEVGAILAPALGIASGPTVAQSEIEQSIWSEDQLPPPRCDWDYPLSTEQVELSLRLDGVPIGSLKRDSMVQVATDTVSTMALGLALEEHATPEHLQVFGSDTHNFAVRGRATFRTPIGMRKVRFAQEGDMVFERSAGSLP